MKGNIGQACLGNKKTIGGKTKSFAGKDFRLLSLQDLLNIIINGQEIRILMLVRLKTP